MIRAYLLTSISCECVCVFFCQHLDNAIDSIKVLSIVFRTANEATNEGGRSGREG